MAEPAECPRSLWSGAALSVHSRSLLFRCSRAQLLSPVSKVGLTVKTFIVIMKCRIFNCRLRQTTLFCYTCSIRASTSKYSAVYTVISAIVQNAVARQDYEIYRNIHTVIYKK